MKFEKYLFGTELNGNVVTKYADDEKIVLVHERNGKEVRRVSFDSKEKYEATIDAALVNENDETYNKTRALSAVLDKFFDTHMLH